MTGNIHQNRNQREKHPFFSKLIQSQITLSQWFDRLLPAYYRIDGSYDFIHSFLPQYFRPRQKVYDVGGGKHPILTSALKNQYELQVIGLDIAAHELEQAPPGVYDAVICADLTHYTGNADGDVAICHALLEHVAHMETAIAGIASILKPGGIAIVFIPSRNALYARLNRMLPEQIKRGALYAIFPQTTAYQGFKSYYDRCTPSEVETLAARYGLQCEARRLYFMSAYFACCFPVYVGWRVWQLVFHLFKGDDAAETFALALRKPIKEHSSL